jgi:hypothetical protein
VKKVEAVAGGPRVQSGLRQNVSQPFGGSQGDGGIFRPVPQFHRDLYLPIGLNRLLCRLCIQWRQSLLSIDGGTESSGAAGIAQNLTQHCLRLGTLEGRNFRDQFAIAPEPRQV